MYIVDGGNFSLPAGRENQTTDQQLPGDPIGEWHRPLHQSEDLHLGARHLLLREVGGRFAFGISSWTILR